MEELSSGITSEQLAHFMEKASIIERLLVLDCRPFMAFNSGHVVTSSNVHCPPILKRRSAGFVALENIVPCQTKRKQLLCGHFTSVVMYDQNSIELTNSASPDSNLYSVTKSFHQQVDMENVFFLKGGYEAFSQAYPHLCVNQTSSIAEAWAGIATSPVTMATLKRSQSVGGDLQDSPVEILPHLYLGDCFHAAKRELLERLGITALMNVSNKCRNYFEEDFLYKTIPVDDNSCADLASWFYEAIDFIELVRKNGGRVLLHCKAGISRSATISLAYLMSTKGFGLEEAFQHVQSRRSVISPNLNFMRQLHDFEKALNASRSEVLASTLRVQASAGVTKTFTWPLPSLAIGQSSPSDFLDYKFDYSPINSPTMMVSSLLTPS